MTCVFVYEMLIEDSSKRRQPSEYANANGEFRKLRDSIDNITDPRAKQKIGSGDRSERIRTYNLPQGRVTDHRAGITHPAIDDILQGEDLDVSIDALRLRQEMDAIASFRSIHT